MQKKPKHIDREKNRQLQQRIKTRAYSSLTLLCKSFIKRASGRFLNIRPSS